MSYFLVPQVHFQVHPRNIKLKFDQKLDIHINKSLANYLKIVKGQINENILQWDNIKKFTNPFEYIHTNVPSHKFSVSKLKPLSRSFFKMIEIYNIFRLDGIFKNRCINSFHLAEGPGGFIEALVYLRKNPLDNMYGMTLIDNNINVPGWKKSEHFLEKNPNVFLERGADGTGDLYKTENLRYCSKNYQNKMDFITGDGGFDFSVDFDKQEEMAFRLIFSQIAFAITMQKRGGVFVLKVFDIFLQPTVELIYLLSCFYEHVYIMKPNTSRYANSEKYVVCKKFKYEKTDEITKKFISIFCVLNKMDLRTYKIKALINIPIQYYYICQLEEMNAVLGQQQIENILMTIKMIEDSIWGKEHIHQIKNQNIKRCVQWCLKHTIPYNKNIQPTNMFLGDN